MTVGGTTVWSQASTDSHVTLPWVTTSTPNGQRTLVVTVRDPANATGTASVAVTVSNP
jgi:mRNA-degrading endonuclease toxin of MazEF toxin-antitoxin module